MTLVLKPVEIFQKRAESGSLGLLARNENWTVKPLGQMIEVINGAPFDSNLFNRAELGKPLVRIRDVGKENTETWFSGTYEDRYLVQRGDILAGLDGDFRVAEWRGPEALLNQRVCKLVADAEVLDRKFMLYHLQGWLDAIWEETSATTVKHLSSKSIQEIPFPCPPLDEQKRIVETLEDHMSRLDKALADLDNADSQTLVFRRSILNALLNPHASNPQRDIESTTIPTGWQTSYLGVLADVLDNKRIPLSAAERKHREGPVPYYGATGQVGTIDKLLFDEPLVLLGEDGVQFFDPYKPKAYKIAGPSWVNNHAHVLRPKAEVIEFGYLLHYLNAFDYQGYANGTTRLKLTQGAMNSIPVHLPPLEEQRRIVETLDNHLSRIDSTRKSIVSQKAWLSTLRKSLLNKAFNGELGTS